MYEIFIAHKFNFFFFNKVSKNKKNFLNDLFKFIQSFTFQNKFTNLSCLNFFLNLRQFKPINSF